MSGDIGLGRLATADAQRDAVHVAVAPVIASEKLSPGDHVRVKGDGSAALGGDTVGIVDPFLRAAVKRGQRFFLFLYPGTITSLRHDWAHPAFADAPTVEAVDPAEVRRLSESWLREFCANDGDAPDYDSLIQAAENWGGEEYLTIRGMDAHGKIPDEVWSHVKVVTGIEGKGQPEYFSCSC